MGRICFIGYPLKGGSAYWRVVLPAETLGVPYVLRDLGAKTVQGDLPEQVSLVVYQQPTAEWHVREIARLVRSGVKVVCSVDDALWAIRKRKDHLKKDAFTKKVWETHLKACRIAGMVVCSTQYLADRYRREGVERVWVVPNPVNVAVYPRDPRVHTARDGIVRIGWQGTTAHAESWLTIRESVERVLGEYSNTRMVFIGEDMRDLVSAEFADRLDHIPYTEDLAEYPKNISTLDIGLAPSIDTAFHRAKSPLRLYEYAMCGVACIATGPTYEPGQAWVPPANSYEWCADNHSFYESLVTFVTQPLLREAMAVTSRLWVMQNVNTVQVAHVWSDVLLEALGGENSEASSSGTDSSENRESAIAH